MAVFVATGALTAYGAVSALMSGGVSAVSETFSAGVEADVKRLGEFLFRQG